MARVCLRDLTKYLIIDLISLIHFVSMTEEFENQDIMGNELNIMSHNKVR
jgi:hypothetical protein